MEDIEITLSVPAQKILSDVVLDENGCWTYTKWSKNYLPLRAMGNRSTPRVAIYNMYFGAMIKGSALKCTCGNKRCVNPHHLSPRKSSNPIPSGIEDVFWKKVDIRGKDDCWNWLGCIDKATGYGKFRYNNVNNMLPHRVAYYITLGDIPDGHFVCHTCDNRSCCNPKHLFIGSPLDNVNDMISKGRNPIGEKDGTAILTEKDVIEIRELLQKGKHTQVEIGKIYGVKSVTICAIKSRRNWGWL